MLTTFNLSDGVGEFGFGLHFGDSLAKFDRMIMTVICYIGFIEVLEFVGFVELNWVKLYKPYKLYEPYNPIPVNENILGGQKIATIEKVRHLSAKK